MSKYLRKFETEAEYSAATIYRPSVSLISDEMTVIFDPKPHDYSEDYFTMVVVGEDGTFSWIGASSANCLSYSTDSGATWSEPSSAITTSTISAGDTVLWKGSGMSPVILYGIGTFSSTTEFNAEGNIMSLLFGDNFSGQTDLTGHDHAFRTLLSARKATIAKLVSVDNLILPATTLAIECYYEMFRYQKITSAPKLPATTLAGDCYSYMFRDCTSLTTAPELPATTLANRCYSYMFKSCTSLTTAPELPATTLANNCYNSMFQGCTSLTTAPVLSATTLKTACCQNMFQGCTSLTTAPVLSATTLTSQCYQNMFSGCTNLSSITCLATDISAFNCTAAWVRGVAASGTFTKAASMTSWSTGVGGIPSGWTVVDYTG